jgi:hypothetical protein
LKPFRARPVGTPERCVSRFTDWGSGAGRCELQVDAEFGVLLAVVAFHQGRSFREITTVDIAFDEPFGEDLFQFHAPCGEEIHGVGEVLRPERVLPVEAQRLAGFAVLIPARVPADWDVDCVFNGPSDLPPFPAQVSVNYRSDDGRTIVALTQFAAANRPAVYDELAVSDGWQDELRDGIVIRVARPRAGDFQAYVERAGTFVFLRSASLDYERLATLAAGLAPVGSSI